MDELIIPHHQQQLPQWSQAETRELLAVRAELDRSFMETKRNKPLWEAVAARMQRKGFHRTPEQCKSKWKNLVTRFKASGGDDAARQFPFHEEMQAIHQNRESSSSAPQTADDDAGVPAIAGFLREMARRRMAMQEEAEAREAERWCKEEEWRRAMEAVLEEREATERRWREREEERRARAEVREDRRHALLVAILTELARGD